MIGPLFLSVYTIVLIEPPPPPKHPKQCFYHRSGISIDSFYCDALLADCRGESSLFTAMSPGIHNV